MSENGTTTTAPDTRGELIGRLKAKLKEFRDQLKAVTDERDAVATERDKAVKAAEKAQADFNAEPLKGEVDRLKGEIRTGKHRAAFDEAAAGAGAPKESLDLLWRESGWKADKDEVDPAAIGEAVKGLKGRADIAPLFGGTAQVETERRPAPARGQGNRVGEGSRVKASSEMLKDPDWCFQNRNALREKRVDLVD